MKRDRSVASGSTIDGGGAILISPSRVQETGRGTDPGFDVMAAMQPTLHEAVMDQLSPLALGKRRLKVFTQYVELFADLPKAIGRGLYTARVR
jgi:hypothetical protein